MWQQQLAFFSAKKWSRISALNNFFSPFDFFPDFFFTGLSFSVSGSVSGSGHSGFSVTSTDFSEMEKTWESILRRLVDSRNWKMVVCGIRTEDTWMETNSRTTQQFTNVLCWGLWWSRPIGVDTRAQVTQILARISVFYCFEKIHYTGLLVSANQQIFH